jgi:hypothetical protein
MPDEEFEYSRQTTSDGVTVNASRDVIKFRGDVRKLIEKLASRTSKLAVASHDAEGDTMLTVQLSIHAENEFEKRRGPRNP